MGKIECKVFEAEVIEFSRISFYGRMIGSRIRASGQRPEAVAQSMARTIAATMAGWKLVAVELRYESKLNKVRRYKIEFQREVAA